eukprot:7379466-Prymnesium_polylepis.2
MRTLGLHVKAHLRNGRDNCVVHSCGQKRKRSVHTHWLLCHVYVECNHNALNRRRHPGMTYRWPHPARAGGLKTAILFEQRKRRRYEERGEAVEYIV